MDLKERLSVLGGLKDEMRDKTGSCRSTADDWSPVWRHLLSQVTGLMRWKTSTFTIFLFLTLAHAGPGESLLGAAEAELPADNAGRLQVPAVVAHRPPLVVFQHLHPALAQLGTSLQPHVSLDDKQTHNKDSLIYSTLCTWGNIIQTACVQ